MRVGWRRIQREQRKRSKLDDVSLSSMRYEHLEAGVVYELLDLYIVYIGKSSLFSLWSTFLIIVITASPQYSNLLNVICVSYFISYCCFIVNAILIRLFRYQNRKKKNASH